MKYNLDELTDSKSSEAGKIVGSFLIGAGVGIAAGILLAPSSGKETLKQLSDKSDAWRNQLKDLLNEASKFVSKYVEQAKDGAADKMNA